MSYSISFEVVSAYGRVPYSYEGTEAQCQAAYDVLKGEPDIVGLEVHKVERNAEYPRAADGHWHVVDGVPQTHTWEECPDNHYNKAGLCPN